MTRTSPGDHGDDGAAAGDHAKTRPWSDRALAALREPLRLQSARSGALRRVTEMTLLPLHELGLAPRRNSFRTAPPGWPGPAHGIAPVFDMDAGQLWRAWMDFAARQPRMALQAQDECGRRSLHVQRSALFRFPDLLRAEVVALGSRRSSLVLDSRSRFGCWDLGVNRRRITRWLHELRQVPSTSD